WVDFARERRESDRYRHWRRSLTGGEGRGSSALPVRSRRGSAGAGQPIQRDVVQDVVASQTARWTAVQKSGGYFLVTVGIVGQHPGRERHGRVEQRVANRLGTGGLFQEVAATGLLEVGKRSGRGAFVVGARRLRAGQGRDQQVHVDAGEPRRC